MFDYYGESRSGGKGRNKGKRRGAYRGAEAGGFELAPPKPVKRKYDPWVGGQKVERFKPCMVHEYLDCVHQIQGAPPPNPAEIPWYDLKILPWMREFPLEAHEQMYDILVELDCHYADELVKIHIDEWEDKDGNWHRAFRPEVKPNKNRNKVSKKAILVQAISKMTEDEIVELVRGKAPSLAAMVEGGKLKRRKTKRKINV